MSEGGDSNHSATDPVVIPGAVVERFHSPASSDEVAEVVAEASSAGASLLIAGGRTRLHWANESRELSAGLSLARLSGVDDFKPEEGVIHAAAGTPIREIQALANTEGWELGLDPPGQTSTLGGTIASAAVGPRSQTFGRVADVVLGLDVVGGDGIRSKCGGRVVKNVTGYDLAKIYCGSFGSFAVICSAWLRLRPLPEVREAFVAQLNSTAADFEACRSVSQCTTLRALIWSESPGDGSSQVAVELGGSREGVDHDREAIARTMKLEGVPLERVDALRDARAAVGEDPIILRARVLGSACGEMTRTILAAGLRVSVDAGMGAIHARGALDQRDQLLSLRRRAGAAGGLAVFENLPDDWRGEFDVFDDQGDGASLASTLKSRFDPAGILNPGRFAGRV